MNIDFTLEQEEESQDDDRFLKSRKYHLEFQDSMIRLALVIWECTAFCPPSWYTFFVKYKNQKRYQIKMATQIFCQLQHKM